MTTKSTVLLAIFLLVFAWLGMGSPSQTLAQEFQVDTRIEYVFDNSGSARVVHSLTLENNTALTYAKSYTLAYDNLTLTGLKSESQNQSYLVEKEDRGNEILIKSIFPDNLVGKGAKREFSLSFTTTSLSQKTGEVWEISIPKLSNPDTYRNYLVIVAVPASWGKESYISPVPSQNYTKDQKRFYLFTKNQLTKGGVTAAYGEFQLFAFQLNYHLENPVNKRVYTEVALPPDTSWQKLYYEQIDPKPTDIRIDEDGNWLAKYLLDPRQRLEIKAVGTVQIFAKDRPLPFNSLPLGYNLQPTQYWPSDNAEIKSLAQHYSTPKDIYDFVVNRLHYDYTRVNPSVSRLGAASALANPDSAICMEYTDLFIAIARAANIPAREVNGYAYTENPQIQPLSLVSDVLHSWPEYWDSSRHLWIAIDPTWGSTTGGEDFFTKLDLRHFTFVNHGKSPVEPYPPGSYKLGANPQKDIYVSFGRLPDNREPIITLESKLASYWLINTEVIITVHNSGPTALYNQAAEIYYDQKLHQSYPITYLLPYTSTSLKLKVPLSFLGAKTPETLEVRLLNSTISLTKLKTIHIITSLIAAFILAAILVGMVFLYFKKHDRPNPTP